MSDYRLVRVRGRPRHLVVCNQSLDDLVLYRVRLNITQLLGLTKTIFTKTREKLTTAFSSALETKP